MTKSCRGTALNLQIQRSITELPLLLVGPKSVHANGNAHLDNSYLYTLWKFLLTHS